MSGPLTTVPTDESGNEWEIEVNSGTDTPDFPSTTDDNEGDEISDNDGTG